MQLLMGLDLGIAASAVQVPALDYHPDDDLLDWEAYFISEVSDLSLTGSDVNEWANRGTLDCKLVSETVGYTKPVIGTVGSFNTVRWGAATYNQMKLRNGANSADIERQAIVGSENGSTIMVVQFTGFNNAANGLNPWTLTGLMWDAGAGYIGIYVANRTDLDPDRPTAHVFEFNTQPSAEVAVVQDAIQVIHQRIEKPAAQVNHIGGVGGSIVTQTNTGAVQSGTSAVKYGSISTESPLCHVLLIAHTVATISAADLAAIVGRLETYFNG